MLNTSKKTFFVIDLGNSEYNGNNDNNNRVSGGRGLCENLLSSNSVFVLVETKRRRLKHECCGKNNKCSSFSNDSQWIRWGGDFTEFHLFSWIWAPHLWDKGGAPSAPRRLLLYFQFLSCWDFSWIQPKSMKTKENQWKYMKSKPE